MNNNYIKNKESGFTLMELTLVMLLIGIMSFTAIPALLNVQAVNLDGASRKLEADLRYAQNLAMTTGESHGLKTTGGTDGSTYEVYKVSDGQPVTSPYDHMPMQEDFYTTGEAYTGVTFPNSDTIVFDSMGTPTFTTGDGDFELQNADGDKKNIIVNNSGLISIQ